MTEKEPQRVQIADTGSTDSVSQWLMSQGDCPDALLAEGAAICAILAPLDMPAEVYSAVRLYPAVRDEFISRRRVQKSSHASLLPLVDGLLQLGRFRLADGWQPGEALAIRQSEALRKMLLAVVSDARLVVARIAEQLCRLRTAKTQDEDTQRQIALETREIYAPLANRLGIWQLKWELEDLAFRFLEPVTYREIATALRETRDEREAFIQQVTALLQENLWNHGIHAAISGRPKHIYSIWRKMQRKGHGLEQIFDVRAVRILVADVAECYAALGVVHNTWTCLPGEFDDYIANPKDNDYQSLHTALIGPDGLTVEVQIRSHDMHRHAELGVAAHWRYKEGSAAGSGFDRKIRLLRRLLDPAGDDGDLLDQLKGDLFEDRVYAVSPRGDVVEMIAGATPLDFAYHVHTQVGHRCRGAKVNGRIVPLTYIVQNGDKIEIITSKTEQPSRDWLSPQLGYLASTRSRTKVRNWFRRQDKAQNLRHGREIFEREITRLNARDLESAKVASQLKYPDADSVYVALGAGDLSAASVASAVQNIRTQDKDDESPTIRRRRPGNKKSGSVAISGVGDLLYNFARCCRPVPPEIISGYITLGRGVSIHRLDCGNFLNLQQRYPERVITVDWGDAVDAIYPADLVVSAFDRQGLLRDVSTVLADESVAVEGVQTRLDKQSLRVEMDISVAVPGLPTLSRVIERLESLPNVTGVRRKS